MSDSVLMEVIRNLERERRVAWAKYYDLLRGGTADDIDAAHRYQLELDAAGVKMWSLFLTAGRTDIDSRRDRWLEGIVELARDNPDVIAWIDYLADSIAKEPGDDDGAARQIVLDVQAALESPGASASEITREISEQFRS